MKQHLRGWILPLLLALILAEAGGASSKEEEFQKIGKMRLGELTAAAQAALKKKYPGEDWEKYKFPQYVYLSDSVLAGYQIAVKEPQLLAKIFCYCFCDEMGHKNLLHCFIQKGVAGGPFDDHASNCNICYTQAMRALLWNTLGASEAQILRGMKEIYGKDEKATR